MTATWPLLHLLHDSNALFFGGILGEHQRGVSRRLLRPNERSGSAMDPESYLLEGCNC